jgi:hypothetical protein
MLYEITSDDPRIMESAQHLLRYMNANSARGRGWTLHDVLRVALIRGIDDWVESASEDEAGWDETA